MHNKNKYLAIVVSSTLLFSSLAQAEFTGPGAAGFSAAGSALQNANALTDQANGTYNKAMDTADNMQQRSDSAKPPVPPKPKNNDGKQSPPKPGNPGFTQFLDASKVSETQKQEIMAAMKGFHDGLKLILDDTALTQEQRDSKISELNSSLVKVILPYVASDKLEAFNKFVADIGNKPLLPPPPKNGDVAKPGQKDSEASKPQENKKNIPKKAKVLSPRTAELFNKKLDAIPQEKKEALFTAVITRIDSLISGVKSEKVKAQLTELREIVQMKLTDLSSQAGEGDILNQVLNGIDSSSTGTTSAK